MATAMEEDDDDPVVQEVDVFLTNTSCDDLYLLQYPLLPSTHTYDNATILAAKIKPKQQKVEIDIGIRTDSRNYSKSKAEQLVLNVDGSVANRTDNCYFESGDFDKQVLTSAPPMKSASSYSIGLLKHGQLHLSPLKTILQMRPSLAYLDKADNTIKSAAADKVDGTGESSQDEAEEKPTPVVVKLGRQETEEMRTARMASYSYVREQRAEEPWIPLNYYGIQSTKAELVRQNLIGQSEHRDSMIGQFELPTCQFDMTSTDYLHELLPVAEELTDEKPALPNNVLSLSQLKTLSIAEQVQALLINAKTIRYSQLLALLPSNTDSTSILRYLQQTACLVQGCWVVKSEIIYPKDTFSAHSGVSSEIICRGRDYIMWKFTQSRYVIRKDISSAIKLPAEEVKELLEQMSRMRANLGWEFLYEYDRDFVERHTEVAQRQKMLWDAKFQALCQQLRVSKETEKKGRDQMGICQIPRRRRRSSAKSPSRTLSGRSHSDFSDTDNEANVKTSYTDLVSKAIHSNFHLKPPKLDGVTKIDDHAQNDANLSSPNISDDNSKQFLDLKSIATVKRTSMDVGNDLDSLSSPGMKSPSRNTTSNPVGLSITDRTVTQSNDLFNHCSANNEHSSLDRNLQEKHPESHDRHLVELNMHLQKFAAKHIRTQLVLTQSEIKRLFALELMQCPPGHILGTGVSYHLIEAAILAGGAVKINRQKWPQDTIPEPVYVTTKLYDGFDQWRDLMVQMFENHHRIKLTTFRDKLSSDYNINTTEMDCKIFLRNYCTTRGSKWILKGTFVGNT